MLHKIFENRKLKLVIIIVGVFAIYQGLIIALVEVEKHSDSGLGDYSNAYWYSLVTLTTVGYGDLYPTTPNGRIVGGVFVLLSMVFYGTIIGSISTLLHNLKENKKLGHEGTNFKNHIIIIGWDDFGTLVTDQLLGVEKKIGIVTDSKTTIDFINDKYHSKNIFTLYNDYSNLDFYRKINIEESAMVFINLEDDAEKLVFVLNLKKVYPNLKFAVVLDNSELKETFEVAGVMHVISKHEISSKLLASYIFEPDVADYAESIMSFADSDEDFDIKQFSVSLDNPLLNMNYEEAFFKLKKEYNAVLIGISKNKNDGTRELFKNPVIDINIELSDYLIMIINGKTNKVLKALFQVEEGLI
ncbi:MAG: NAD-binding protein [Flammeovirgaceae bacterium]|nr:NAD-binding protein [Flammeovirgaceae bacterium]